jgi:hypothetical protein
LEPSQATIAGGSESSASLAIASAAATIEGVLQAQGGGGLDGGNGAEVAGELRGVLATLRGVLAKLTT